MSDALLFPPRPSIAQYRTLARDLQRACRSTDPDAIQTWAAGWITALLRLRPVERTGRTENAIQRESQRLARRWHQHTAAHARAGRCLLADAQYFIAREHGFASWPKFVAHVEGLARPDSPVSVFERAVDAIVAGDAPALERLLREHPDLPKARSTRDHRSTLLHYVSANGVEDFRQQTPANIVAITRMLLAAGAEVDAASDAYGGGSTALGLVATSLHPEQAGVQIELLETLLDHGARIEQPGLAGNQHSAIRGCLANGQGQAARFFASRGARMHLVEAAGVGRLDVVRTFFDDRGAPRDGVTMDEMAEGFLYACGYGHPDVVSYLVDRGVGAGTVDKNGQTGLHWAMYGPHIGVIEALLEHDAPVNARDAQQGTPLDWAVNGWGQSADPAERDLLIDAMARLVGAGGAITPSWFALNERRQRALEQARTDPRLRALLGP